MSAKVNPKYFETKPAIGIDAYGIRVIARLVLDDQLGKENPTGIELIYPTVTQLGNLSTLSFNQIKALPFLSQIDVNWAGGGEEISLTLTPPYDIGWEILNNESLLNLKRNKFIFLKFGYISGSYEYMSEGRFYRITPQPEVNFGEDIEITLKGNYNPIKSQFDITRHLTKVQWHQKKANEIVEEIANEYKLDVIYLDQSIYQTSFCKLIYEDYVARHNDWFVIKDLCEKNGVIPFLDGGRLVLVNSEASYPSVKTFVWRREINIEKQIFPLLSISCENNLFVIHSSIKGLKSSGVSMDDKSEKKFSTANIDKEGYEKVGQNIKYVGGEQVIGTGGADKHTGINVYSGGLNEEEIKRDIKSEHVDNIYNTSTMFKAQCSTIGLPTLKFLERVKIEGLGFLDGDYMINEIHHTISISEFATEFTIQANAASGLSKEDSARG